MIKPEEISWCDQELFIKELATVAKYCPFTENDAMTCSIDLMPKHDDKLLISNSFVTSQYNGTFDKDFYKLNNEASKALSSLGWYEEDEGFHIFDFIIRINCTTYSEDERKQLQHMYPNIDVSPLLDLHDKLFSKFNIPETNISSFDDWFTNIVTKHRNNLTDTERRKHSIILNEVEKNNDYMRYGVFYEPYRRYLKDNGWIDDAGGVIQSTSAWEKGYN